MRKRLQRAIVIAVLAAAAIVGVAWATISYNSVIDLAGHSILNATFTGATVNGVTIPNASLTNPTMTGGTGTNIGTTTVTTLTASNGNLNSLAIISSNANLSGGSINGTTVGATTAASVRATTLTGTDTTAATSATTGALQTAGGLGVAMDASVGTTLNQDLTATGCTVFTANVNTITCNNTKFPITSGVTTTVFTITTTPGQAGAYSVKINGDICVYRTSPIDRFECLGTLLHFSRAKDATVGDNSAITVINVTAIATTSGNIALDNYMVSVAETDEDSVTIDVWEVVSGTAPVAGRVAWEITLDYGGFAKAPVIAGN